MDEYGFVICLNMVALTSGSVRPIRDQIHHAFLFLLPKRLKADITDLLQVVVLFALAWMDFHELVLTGDFWSVVQIWDLVTDGQNGTAAHSHIYVAKASVCHAAGSLKTVVSFVKTILNVFIIPKRKVYLVGRRGPVQAACTAKELREILAIKDLHINIKESDLLKTSADEEEMKNNGIRRRVFELLSKASSSASPHPSLGQRELYFTFFRKPEKFLKSSDRSGYVDGVNFETTTLKGSASVGCQIAVGTGQYEDLNCGLVLKSIDAAK
nr:NADPH:adrenodoxin oxidoreductase, mitochondrial isoform X2 [Tanacetum cinerariifolium]